MRFFHKKAENVAAKELEKKEELSPFEASKQGIIFQYATKDASGVGIDLRKVIILTVKPEETSKDEEDIS